MNLYTYTIPYDDGAAPNPFGGFCTLAICKPVIRRTAKVGDWVAAFGSRSKKGRDGLVGRLVYAMKITEIMTLEKYNEVAPQRFPVKIPDINSPDVEKRLGDCLYYNFKEGGSPKQRKGVHNSENKATDLRGVNVLVSDHYYYFGNNAIPLGEGLEEIPINQQGHKKQANDDYKESFVDWLENESGYKQGLHGDPGMLLDWSSSSLCSGCSNRKNEAENDHEVKVGC